jgi:hypothetical protein
VPAPFGKQLEVQDLGAALLEQRVLVLVLVLMVVPSLPSSR